MQELIIVDNSCDQMLVLLYRSQLASYIMSITVQLYVWQLPYAMEVCIADNEIYTQGSAQLWQTLDIVAIYIAIYPGKYFYRTQLIAIAISVQQDTVFVSMYNIATSIKAFIPSFIVLYKSGIITVGIMLSLRILLYLCYSQGLLTMTALWQYKS